METQAIITLLIIGIAAGILSGLVGVGGGIILVPALIYFFRYSQHQAQGTSLGVLLLPVVFLGFYQYYIYCREAGTPIDFKIIALLAAGFIFGGFFGGKIAARIDTAVMKKIFAVILIYTALKLLAWDLLFFKWMRQLFTGNSA
ncbi:TSUP family transporter [Flavihumibacter profundi]|jgi:uncharacterized protein|uniref:TSUP family transporter n=1 Tax=Flavihumibacter profundi TaxID=2716883 RepID=UPI0021D47361|nr:TSUP family transporter [Flavihumibacter profundi]